MKTTQRLVLAISFCLLSCALLAQQNVQANRVLAASKGVYRSVTSLSADIQYGVYNEAQEIDHSSYGDFAVSGNKYRMNTVGHQIANNGQKIYSYSPQSHEIVISPFYPQQQDIVLTPMGLLSLVQRGYIPEVSPDEMVNGMACHILDMYGQANNSFSMVRLAISKIDLTLQAFYFVDRDNTVYSYFLGNVRYNEKIPSSKFRMSASTHPGATVTNQSY